MRFSMPEFASDMSADGTSIALDMPGGGYDRLHDLIEQKLPLPQGRTGRIAIIAVMLTASRLVKQQLGAMGPVSNFFNEIGNDAVREESKRILEVAGRRVVERESSNGPKTNLDVLWDMDDTSRSILLAQFRRLDAAGRQHMREQMLRSTARELAMLAGLSQEDLTTMLEIMSPESQKRPGIADRVATTLFPWLA